jgi:hypothetical protein
MKVIFDAEEILEILRGSPIVHANIAPGKYLQSLRVIRDDVGDYEFVLSFVPISNQSFEEEDELDAGEQEDCL